MKIVRMEREFDYRARPRVFVHYRAGKTYKRVPEAHAVAIVAAGAGTIVEPAEQ
jgi:hypothetical protein